MNNKAVIAIGILLLVIGLIMIGVAVYRKNQNDKCCSEKGCKRHSDNGSDCCDDDCSDDGKCCNWKCLLWWGIIIAVIGLIMWAVGYRQTSSMAEMTASA